MIKKIIACADVHIRNLRRHEEYQAQLNKFVADCKKYAEEYGPEQIRIVVAGDLLHNKLDISGEGYIIASWFIRQLSSIAKTIIIAGNHDMNMKNLSRLDPISAIFSMSKFDNAIYLDKELDYESGYLVDENVTWCLYSTFDNFARPNIEEAKALNPDNVTVGLFHGELKSAKTDVGYVSENGYEASYFEGLDFAILGHIHKRQCIKNDGVPLVYCGSLIQQDHGENIHGHGYVVWDLDTFKYEEVDIANEGFGYYTFSINGIEDIEEDSEDILNL